MNIIQHGRLPEEKSTTKRFKCANCGCVFEADKGEYRGSFQYNEFYFYCECPECKHTSNEIVTRDQFAVSVK
ncbi:MAG: hypothetical protein K2N06_05545 [Oscillospiraceae bacterium]|nr:hypothetical protein [Oscillospiraceae bacterium]